MVNSHGRLSDTKAESRGFLKSVILQWPFHGVSCSSSPEVCPPIISGVPHQRPVPFLRTPSILGWSPLHPPPPNFHLPNEARCSLLGVYPSYIPEACYHLSLPACTPAPQSALIFPFLLSQPLRPINHAGCFSLIPLQRAASPPCARCPKRDTAFLAPHSPPSGRGGRCHKGFLTVPTASSAWLYPGCVFAG